MKPYIRDVEPGTQMQFGMVLTDTKTGEETHAWSFVPDDGVQYPTEFFVSMLRELSAMASNMADVAEGKARPDERAVLCNMLVRDGYVSFPE